MQVAEAPDDQPERLHGALPLTAGRGHKPPTASGRWSVFHAEQPKRRMLFLRLFRSDGKR